MPNQGLEVASSPAASSHPCPFSLAAWIREAWNQVLFPGTAPRDTRPRWTALVLLLLLPGALLYPCLSFHLFEPDEGRYAEIPREMLQRGEWVVPYLQSEPYLDKPPLLYWLVMGCYQVLGVHDWAARLAPALAVHGCLLLVYLLGRRSLGERAAFWGALLLGLAPGFLSMGRLLVLDGLLALWVTLALLSGWEAIRQGRLRWGWWLIAAGACGLGILTKGPVALLLFLPPLWLQRRLGPTSCCIPRRAWLAFFLVLLAVALPWYVAICLRLPAFARYFLWEHNVVRFLAPFDHLEPIWFYVPILLAGLLPATLLLPPLLRWFFSTHAAARAQRCPELGFMILAGTWCVLFFSLSGCKLPTYVLPAFPPLALVVGYFVAARGWERSPWLRCLAATGFVLLLLAHHLVIPWYAWYRSPASRLAEIGRYCADPQTPVICFPRSCDSVAFYLGRDDLRTFRSKQIDPLRAALRQQERTIVLCTHRHSLEGLRQALPPELRLYNETHFALGRIPGLPTAWLRQATRWAGETPWGLCDVAVVDRKTR